jgi:hypothetical protein
MKLIFKIMNEETKTKFELSKLPEQLKGLRCFDGNQQNTICTGGTPTIVSLFRGLTDSTKTEDFGPKMLVALLLLATLHNLSLDSNKPVTISGGNGETYLYNPVNNTIKEILPK